MCSYHSVNPGFSHPLPSSKEKKLIRLTFPLSALLARRPVSKNEGGGKRRRRERDYPDTFKTRTINMGIARGERGKSGKNVVQPSTEDRKKGGKKGG